MKKTIVKNLLILSLAFGALVVIGNNVYGNDTEIKEIDLPEFTITCGQFSGHCWTVSAHSNCACNWVGAMGTHCVPC